MFLDFILLLIAVIVLTNVGLPIMAPHRYKLFWMIRKEDKSLKERAENVTETKSFIDKEVGSIKKESKQRLDDATKEHQEFDKL